MGDVQAEATESTHASLEAAEIDALLSEFGGDSRAAIAALLHDLDAMARDAEASTSFGYVRGKVVRLKVRPVATES